MTEPTHHYADLGDVVLHYVLAGEGEPVVLLHGWPQTWYQWRKVIAPLAERYQVIAPDMRGLGDSSRPLDGYDTHTVGEDIHRLLTESLGHDRFMVAGHDWGGPVGYAIASNHPEAVTKLALLDVTIPGAGDDLNLPDDGGGGRKFRHPFHRIPDLPEALTQGRERIYLSYVYRAIGGRPDAISDADIDEYVRTYSMPGAMRAGFSYYRAVFKDMELNDAALAKGKLQMPVLALGGNSRVGRKMETLESAKRFAAHVQGGMIEDCGHWMAEERPAELVERLKAFFGE